MLESSKLFVQKEGHTPELVAKEERLALGLDNSVPLRLFWFLCGNEVYTDRISAK
jgi:hypothetical protein